MTVRDTEASPATDTEIPTGGVAESQVQDSAAQAGDDTAAASTATDVKEPTRSLLDVVKDAVQPAEAPGEASPQDPEKQEAAETKAEDSEEFTPEEIDKLPFGKHPRFKRLLSDNKELKGKLTEFQAQAAEFKTGHDQYQVVDQFLRTNEIVPDEFVRLMKIGALVKQDPEGARKEVLQVLFELDDQLGLRLPDPLKADVEEGRITEDRALELSQANARAARLAERQAQADEQRQAESTADQAQRHTQACISAVAAWESQRASKDPDFAGKADFVVDRVQLWNATEGYPKTPEEAVARAERAYDEVTQRMRRAIPPKPEMRRGPESGRTPSNVSPRPGSLKDAILQAVNG